LAIAAMAVVAWARPAAADLGGDIRGILRDKMLGKAEVGVCIDRLGPDAGRCAAVFEFNPTAPLTPASNLKVVTTSAMLDRVGPEFRFHTSLVMRGNDLILVGDGDPTFGDVELLKKSNWGTLTVFQNWAKLLSQRGITHVDRVLVDDSIFDDVFFHPNWPVAQAHLRYEAAVGGVNLNANCVDFYLHVSSARQLVSYTIDPPTAYITVHNACVAGGENAVWLSRSPGSNDVTLRGQADASNDQPISVSVQDPPMFAATVLSETLAANGIKVSGSPGRDRTVRKMVLGQTPAATAGGAAMTVLAVHETPLAAALARANKDSMNLYAECLCKRLGAATNASGDNGSWESGLAAVRAFLGKVGVPTDQYHLDDGSGLSHENAITARALCQVLIYDYLGKNRAAFVDSLGIGGVDGKYFQQRFANTDLRGRVFGKSGFVNGVSGLTGFLKAKDGNWYCFSILMNGIPNGGNSTAKSLQERIVGALDNSTVNSAVSAAAR
jgi:serine-type D-Ala-D-Ala carboxypeptidase/endopeptidase (penicillin-binding protein 4)